MSNKPVKVGVSPQDLEEQGVDYDAKGFAPELPDFLGYFLALLVIWLVYTGYRSAVTAMRKPITKISEQAVQLKTKVDEFTSEEPRPGDSPAVQAAAEEVDEQEGGWWSKINRINIGISRAVEYTNTKISSWFSSADFEEPLIDPIERDDSAFRERQSTEPIERF